LPGIAVSLKALKPNIFAELPTPLGEHLRAQRLALRLTLKAVAGRLGVSLATVSNWENNKTRPTPAAMAAITRFLRGDPS
jgi:transcriptional regulator with XRE-family HTH domain